MEITCKKCGYSWGSSVEPGHETDLCLDCQEMEERNTEKCPSCLQVTAPRIYRQGDPQPTELPDTDMDQALHGRESMRYCQYCGFDLDAES